MIENNDPFYFSRSDINEEEKIRILKEQIALGEADIAAGRFSSSEDVRKRLVNRFSALIKQTS